MKPNVVPLSTDALRLLHFRVSRYLRKSETMGTLEHQIRTNREQIDQALTLIKSKGGTAEIEDIVKLMDEDFIAENRKKEVYLRVQAELEKYEDLKKKAVNEIVEDLHRAQSLQDQQEQLEQQKLQNKKVQLAQSADSKKANSQQQDQFTELLNTVTEFSTVNLWFGRLATSDGSTAEVSAGDTVSKLKWALGHAEEVVSKLVRYKHAKEHPFDSPDFEANLPARILSPRSGRQRNDSAERLADPQQSFRFDLGKTPAVKSGNRNSVLPSILSSNQVSVIAGPASQRIKLKQAKKTSVASSVDTEPYTKSHIHTEGLLPKVRDLSRHSKDDSGMQHVWSRHSREWPVADASNPNASFDLHTQTISTVYQTKMKVRKSVREGDKEVYLGEDFHPDGLLNLREYRKIMLATFDQGNSASPELDKLLKQTQPSRVGSPRKIASTRFVLPKVGTRDQTEPRSRADHAAVKSVDRGVSLY